MYCERWGAVWGHGLFLVLIVLWFNTPPSTIWDDVNKYMLEQITKHDSWIYERLQILFFNFFQSEENRRLSCVQSVAGRHIIFFPSAPLISSSDIKTLTSLENEALMP